MGGDPAAQRRHVLRALRSAVHRLYRADAGEDRAARADDFELLRPHRRRRLHRRAVHRPVHRHDRLRLPLRPLRAAHGLRRLAALVHGRQRDRRDADRRLRPQRLAFHFRDRARRRDGDDRRLFERNGAEASARPGVRLFAGDRLLLRADRLVPRLRTRAAGPVRHRRLALGGADRRGRGGAGRLSALRPAREPALARPPGAARGGRSHPERDRSQGRGGIRQAAAAAGADRADLARFALRRPLDAERARPRDPDERVQHFPDRRLLRLPELGPDAARRPGGRDHQEPRLHHGDRARRAGRAADRLLRSATGSSARSSSSRPPARSSSSAWFSARRKRRRRSSLWASA